MLIARGADSARVQLVPERALLLAGDDVALEIEVEAGLRLELGEVGGTVAYDMRGGSARWRTSYRVETGASLVHQTLSWVSAEGSDVERLTEAHLYGDASLVLRETLVLGRYGEAPGALVAHTKVYRDGAEVLVEELHASDLVPAVGTGHRVLDQVLALGAAGPDKVKGADATRLNLVGGGHLWRLLSSAHTCSLALPSRSMIAANRAAP